MRASLWVGCVCVSLALGGCVPAPSGGAHAGEPASSVITAASPTDASTPAPSSSAQASAETSATPSANSATPSPSATEPAKPLAGKVIVVDPGHNGRYKKSFNTRKVPAGSGRTKACNSSGTAGKALSEHAYTWAQAKLLTRALENLGARVVLTRHDDSGLGPCVDKRARTANDAEADLLISLHADGNLSRKARGFHVIVSTTMDGSARSRQSALEKKSLTLAKHAIAALRTMTPMPKSTYIGKGTALSPRTDIATLNLLKATPGIMLEIGNMRQPKDLALLKSSSFRKDVAKALAKAAVETLG